MSNLHRLQWIDAQIRAGHYPNTRALAEQFETSSQQNLLGSLATYYATVARRDSHFAATYAEMAELFQRLGGADSDQAAPGQTSLPIAVPYRALLQTGGGPMPAKPPAPLEPFWRGQTGPNEAACEFADPDAFLQAFLSCLRPWRIHHPGWLRTKLAAHLRNLQTLCTDPGDMTRHVTPPPLSWDRTTGTGAQSPDRTKGRNPIMQKQAVTTKARFTCHWNSWAGAVHGVLTAAGMYEGDMSRLMGITGTLFHVIMHEECCVSSATVYDWPVEHKFGLDRLGVLTEQYNAMTDETTYEAARRRAVTNIKAAVDRGVGVVLWGVDSGEFGVVYGYDDADGVLLVDGYFGMNGGSNPILYENVGRSFEGAPFLDYLIPVEKVAFDPAKSYRGSLEYYVRHMEAARHVAPAYKSGLLAYDNWLRALEQGKYQAHGLRYNPTVYAENKREAVAYLKFLAAEWNPRLAPAVPVFERIHEVYSRMMTVLGHQMPDSVPLFAAVEPEQAAGLIPLVKEARDLEVEALAIVKAALA